jgi:hypothetical protein
MAQGDAAKKQGPINMHKALAMGMANGGHVKERAEGESKAAQRKEGSRGEKAEMKKGGKTRGAAR